MGAFKTKTTLFGNPNLIPNIANRICEEFAADGYETKRDNLVSGGIEIFLSKGGVFKEVLGMRTALLVTLIPNDNSISFEAGIGIFGQQFVPTIISMLFAWPVLLTQMWGLVKQSKLDEKALSIANSIISEMGTTTQQNNNLTNIKFCTNCGSQLSPNARFCSNCGNKVF